MSCRDDLFEKAKQGKMPAELGIPRAEVVASFLGSLGMSTAFWRALFDGQDDMATALFLLDRMTERIAREAA